MRDGKIFYALHEKTVFLKLAGEITYAVSYGFDNFINEVFNNDMADKILIDLRETRYIDSTNLGLLAKISIKLKQRGKNRPVLISSNEDINIILQSMGFNDVFIIVKDHELSKNIFSELTDADDSEKELARVMLEAHEALIAMNNENSNTFLSVVELLKKEIK